MSIYCTRLFHLTCPFNLFSKKKTSNLLSDDRFKSMFENPAFQVDTESEEYRLLNPLVSKLDKERKKKLDASERKQQALLEQFDDVEVRLMLIIFLANLSDVYINFRHMHMISINIAMKHQYI